jgi:hypothetical protein
VKGRVRQGLFELDWPTEIPIQENSRPTLNRTGFLNTKDTKETKNSPDRRPGLRQDLQDEQDILSAEIPIQENPGAFCQRTASITIHYSHIIMEYASSFGRLHFGCSEQNM